MIEEKQRVFYGWYLVAVCFIINFIVFGISVNTFTVYVKPIVTDMDWTRAQFSFGLTLASLAMAVVAPFVGRLIDKTGARIAMAIGISTVGFCTVMLSKAAILGQFYLLYMISGMGQAAATLIPISLVISNWFELKRGRALGIVMTGTGLGAMVMVPVTSWIVVNWGWRTSYFVMGLVILSMVPLCLIFIRTRPADLGLKPDGGLVFETETVIIKGFSLNEAVKTGSFWFISAMMFLFGLIGMGLTLHLMPYLTDIGHKEITAGMIISVVSAMTVVGKVGMGVIADRWGLRKVLMLTCGLIIIGILLLMRAETLKIALIFASIYGLAIGVPLLINPALTAFSFGLKHYGTIFGILSLFNIFGAGIGATLTGAIFDSAGSYMPAFWAYILLVAVSGFCGIKAKKEAQ